MIKKLGKIGKINQDARRHIAEISERLGLTSCALQLIPECQGEAHAPAHRHPRIWYRPFPEKLWAFEQWIEACTNCHTFLDDRSVTSEEESEEIFMRIRGPEL